MYLETYPINGAPITKTSPITMSAICQSLILGSISTDDLTKLMSGVIKGAVVVVDIFHDLVCDVVDVVGTGIRHLCTRMSISVRVRFCCRASWVNSEYG